MTQDIRELLELAANACGLQECGWMGPAFVYVKDSQFIEWSPHLDDGDGARMETQLGIGLHRLRQVVEAFVDRDSPTSEMYYDPEITWSESYADHNGNRQAARRMASLRVAAEIGRRMKT